MSVPTPSSPDDLASITLLQDGDGKWSVFLCAKNGSACPSMTGAQDMWQAIEFVQQWFESNSVEIGELSGPAADAAAELTGQTDQAGLPPEDQRPARPRRRKAARRKPGK